MRNRKMIVALIVIMSIGFAAVTATLITNGVLNISENTEDFDVIFKSAKLNNLEKNDVIDSTKKNINFVTDELSKVDEEATLEYEIENKSALYDANVVLTCEASNSEYVTISYEPSELIVEAKKTKVGRLTARLLKASNNNQEINIACTLNANAIERETLGEEYIEPFSAAGTMKATTQDDISDFWKYKSNVTKVVFENRLNPYETSEDLIFDVSDENSISPVKAYLVQETSGEDSYTLYIQSLSGIYANADSSYLFYDFENLEQIEGLEYFKTTNVTNMNYMFANCMSLKNIDVSNFETMNVTSMEYMFYECRSFETLDVSSFDTSQVVTMKSMFSCCRKLTKLDLSNFNTENVTNMNNMFSIAAKIMELDIRNFSIDKLTDSASAFDYMSGNIIIKVKDENVQKWAIDLSVFTLLEPWTTENVIVV